MKKIGIYFLFIFSYCISYSQNNTQIKYLAGYCKFWGFLKYYHPAVSSKNIDWDEVLVENYPKVMASHNKEELNKVFLSIEHRLGELKAINQPFVPADSLSKNADFAWIQDTTLFDTSMISYLQRIKQNHGSFINKFYYKKLTIRINEKPYSEMVFPDERYRFLALARYWNIINYYDPGKYLMDVNWNTSLEQAITIFIQASSQNDYYRAIEFISARINDSHAFKVTQPIEPQFKYPPFNECYNGDSLIIRKVWNDSLGKIYDIKRGDLILKINNIPVREIWKDIVGHTSASNPEFIGYTLNSIFLATKNDSTVFEIQRGDKIFSEKIINYKNEEVPVPVDKGKSFYIIDTLPSQKFGYLNLAKLKKEEIDKILNQMEDIKYLIVDLRNYPDNTMMPELLDKLLDKKYNIAKYIEPDFEHPGYLGKEEIKSMGQYNKNAYKGKIIVLIHHSTISSAEFYAMAFTNMSNAILIGTKTAGTEGARYPILLPGNYMTYITTALMDYPDGKITQRIGIIPNIKVEYNYQSILNGKDPIMERAVEYIKTGQ